MASNFDMNPEKFRNTFQAINHGTVMEAAARNLQKEMMRDAEAASKAAEGASRAVIDMQDLEQARSSDAHQRPVMFDWPRACPALPLAALTADLRATGRGARANPPRPHRADEGAPPVLATVVTRTRRGTCCCRRASQLHLANARAPDALHCWLLRSRRRRLARPATRAHAKPLRSNPLQREAEKRAAMSTKGHGSYEEVGEGEFLPAVTGSSHCVVHFYHNEFERCRRVGGRARRSAQRALNPPRPSAEYWTSTWDCSPNNTSPRASSKSTRRCDTPRLEALLPGLPRASPAFYIANHPAVTGCAVLRAQAWHSGAAVRGHVP